MRPNLFFLAALLLGLGAAGGAAAVSVTAGDAAPAGQPDGLSLCTTVCRRPSAYEGAFVEHGVCYAGGHVKGLVDSADAPSPNDAHAQLLRMCPRP